MKLIVGLGNPGKKYEGTRHNLGFDIVDLLASRWGISLAREKFHGWFGKGELADSGLLLLKPSTFMNRSGSAIVAAGRFYRLALEDLLVIADDLALPPGRIRLRADGSAGSHKGLQDVIDRLGTNEWCRLRVGIGSAVGDPSDYVLERFDKLEEDLIERAREYAADAVECWVKHGIDLAMARFNGDPPGTTR